jgi:hypothetical protein
MWRSTALENSDSSLSTIFRGNSKHSSYFSTAAIFWYGFWNNILSVSAAKQGYVTHTVAYCPNSFPFLHSFME